MDEEKNETSPLLPRTEHRRVTKDRHRKFPITRARVIAILTPMLVGAATVSRESLIAQYLVDRLGESSANTSHNDGNGKCGTHNSSHNFTHSGVGKSSKESQAAELLGNLALCQTIPAIIACLLLGSYSDFLGRRILLLCPLATGVIKTAMTSVIIGLDLSLDIFYLTYFIDGLAGSFFGMIIALYSLTADINKARSSRAFYILAILAAASVTQAAVNVPSGIMIDTLGFLEASFLSLAVITLAFLVAFFLLPETLGYSPENTPGSHTVPSSLTERLSVRTLNPLHHLRRLFGFYLFDGTRHQRLERVLCMLVILFPVANDINLATIDSLYQLSEPFCWSSTKIGTYSAVRIGSTGFFGGIWMVVLNKCLSFEVIGIIALLFQSVAYGFEAFVNRSWQFYVVPALLVPANCITAIIRTILSLKAPADMQGALFSSIAVVETLVNLVSTTTYNRIYSETSGSALSGAVYLVMAGVSFVGLTFFCIYLAIRERLPTETANITVSEGSHNTQNTTEAAEAHPNIKAYDRTETSTEA